MGRSWRPKFFIFFVASILSPPPKAAVSRMDAAGTPTAAPKAPKGGAGGATSPEGEGNPAESGSSRVCS